MTIGNVTTVRWLNTAVTLCRIYLSVHGLNAKDTKNLNLIIVFIVAYYFPMYFYIKVSSKGSIQKCDKFHIMGGMGGRGGEGECSLVNFI